MIGGKRLKEISMMLTSSRRTVLVTTLAILMFSLRAQVACAEEGRAPKVNGEAQFRLGESFFNQNRWQDSITAYERLLSGFEKSDDTALAVFHLASAYYNLEKFDDATRYYSRLIEEYPTSPYVAPSQFNLALAYKKIGKLDMAQYAYQKYVAGAKPGDAQAQNALWEIYQIKRDRKDFDGAISILEQIKNAGMAEGELALEVMYRISETNTAAGRPDEARVALEQMRTMKPLNSAFRLQALAKLGEAYEQAGNMSAAADVYEDYSRAAPSGLAQKAAARAALLRKGTTASKAPALASTETTARTPSLPAKFSQQQLDEITKALNNLQQPPAHPSEIISEVDKPQYSATENSNNFAVVVGVEKYASLPAAEFAERDAQAVRAHLMALGYPTRNIYFLNGSQATKARIAQSINTWLPRRTNENSTVFFYYSGHGAPDPQTNQAYLVPLDGDTEDLDSTAYPIKVLYEKLGKIKARQVIVALDSCFSGAGGRSVLAKGTRPLVGKIDMGGVPNNVLALTASNSNEISGTIADQGHGAFTFYLLKGLEGAAKNGSGAVTVQSLYDYLTPKVQDAARLHNRDQTPQLLKASGGRAEIRLR